MTTEPNDGSISSVASMLMETPEQETPTQENQSEAVEETTETTDDGQIDVEDYIAESDDDTGYDSDEGLDLDSEIVDEDDYTAEAAVPLELSDDLELEVKSDGRIKKVTLKELKQDFAGQDYIQKGMEQNAQTRKELDNLQQAMLAERAQLAQRIADFDNGNVPQMPQKPSKELENSDPLAYAIQLGEYRDAVEEYEKFQHETRALKERQAEQEHLQLQAYRAQQAEQLKQELPELRDPEKSKKLLNDIQQTATGYYGVPQEVLGALSHGWEFKIMRDAVAYRKLVEKRGKVEQKSQGARPALKPGAKRTEDGKAKKRQQTRSRMKKRGDIASVADYLLS